MSSAPTPRQQRTLQPLPPGTRWTPAHYTTHAAGTVSFPLAPRPA